MVFSVGTSTGKIEMWDARSQENMFSRMFSIWNNKEGGSQEKMSSRNFSFLNREEGQCSKSVCPILLTSNLNRITVSYNKNGLKLKLILLKFRKVKLELDLHRLIVYFGAQMGVYLVSFKNTETLLVSN